MLNRTGNPGRCGPCNGTANSFLERETNTMAVSRREFLNRVGRAGGYSAAFLMMQGMGLMPAAAAAGRTRGAWVWQRSEGSDPGRRDRRAGGSLRAPRPGIRMHTSRKPAETRGKKLDGSRRRQSYLSGRNHADLLVGRGALSEFWTSTAALRPSHHAGLLSKAGCAA